MGEGIGLTRFAFIKQSLDVFGPWASVPWSAHNPKEIFAVWPGKATLWEMTCALQADWYIIPQSVDTDYTRDVSRRSPALREWMTPYVRDVIDLSRIPFDRYDVVISFDPILTQASNPKPLYAYYANEHWDDAYTSSLRCPRQGYDLFLAHMMDAAIELRELPQSVSFPYLRAPLLMRSIFPTQKEESIWVDWRTLAGLAGSELWNSACIETARQFEKEIGVEVRWKEYGSTAYGIENPPRWGDGLQYLQEMAACNYYLGLGRVSGAGQALCDAASLGSICFGEKNKIYPEMVCHPSCLCDGFRDVGTILRRVLESKDLQAEILARQDEALHKYFWEYPMHIMEEARTLKERSKSSIRPSYSIPQTMSQPEAREKMIKSQASKDATESVTIFAMPKAFQGNNAIIQRNAILSWTLMKPRPEIILFGEEEGIADICLEMGLRHVPKAGRNEYGTPLVNGLIGRGELFATGELLVYVNADILLLSDFLPALVRVAAHFPQFLMIGKRFNLDIDFAVDTNRPDWENALKIFAQKNGKYHSSSGIDYFGFRRGLWKDIPPFAIGRTAWDNWLVYDPLKRKMPVVDASDCVFAIHQNHDWSHVQGGYNEAWNGVEAQRNRNLAAGTPIATIADADWKLTAERVVRNDHRLPWFEEGMEYLKRGRPQLALMRFDGVLDLDSSLPNLQYARAVALFQLGRLQEAARAAQEELRIRPQAAEVLLLLQNIEAARRANPPGSPNPS